MKEKGKMFIHILLDLFSHSQEEASIQRHASNGVLPWKSPVSDLTPPPSAPSSLRKWFALKINPMTHLFRNMLGVLNSTILFLESPQYEMLYLESIWPWQDCL